MTQSAAATVVIRHLPGWLVCLLLCLGQPAAAWDSTGHRLSAAVMLEFVSEEVARELLTILGAHPRYQQDFLDEIPRFIDQRDQQALHQWLLGQAAFWPDIARGLPMAERKRYNRPWWHYIDGAWVRGAARQQGNLYLDTPDPGLTEGEAAATITDETDVSNVITAMDYNVRVLTDPDVGLAEQAIALCWVLHLAADIHQPLHSGSLFSPRVFASGDRGGNGIPVKGSRNLHALWDRALAEGGVVNELPLVLAAQTPGLSPDQAASPDWTRWLHESRQLLPTVVYSDAIIAAIRQAERNDGEIPYQTLDAAYVARMREVARQRLGLAGLRLADFFTRRLPPR